MSHWAEALRLNVLHVGGLLYGESIIIRSRQTVTVGELERAAGATCHGSTIVVLNVHSTVMAAAVHLVLALTSYTLLFHGTYAARFATTLHFLSTSVW